VTAGSSYLASGSLFAGRFEIGRELGRGGVSVVYAARDRSVGQDVALKLLVPSPATANQTRERMRREVHAVRGLVHPNIVAVYDFVEDGAYGAVIMELVDGEDLDARVRRGGPLSPDDVARLGTEVASALEAAHRRGVLHRDVKPQNILLERDGRARLADFGSARMDGDTTITRTGAMVGTLAYMAPESVAGRRGDARADVFALGMTLFYAAAGRLPDRPSPHLPLPASASGYTPIALGADVPPWLAHVIARATSADPGDRFPTPTALADALTSRDARTSVALATLSRNRCVLCGGLDVLGTAVCPGCASGSQVTETLVFLERPRSASERDAAIEATAALLGNEVPREMLASVALGDRALMAVPLASRANVITVLDERGLRARTFAPRDVWRALSPTYVLMVGGVVASGLVGGMVADNALFAAAGPIAVLLLIGGALSIRKPVLTADGRMSALSEPTRARVVETFAGIPAGPARSLLADVVQRGHAVRRALVVRQDTSGAGETVEELIDAACASARDLAALDASLAQFARERDTGDAKWLDSLTECERTRDGVVQRLLDAVTVLGQLDVQAIRGSDDTTARLGELVAEIGSEVKARSAAREEMATLLAVRTS
jgi:predicted Ser/Thr protein kinase